MILRSMRNGFFSALFLGLLVLGGVSLIFTDWNGMFKGGVNKTDVAKVDGTPIKIAEFNTRVTRILRQQQIDPAAAYQIGLIDNILSQEIYDLLIKKNAIDLGIRIEDRIIADQIKSYIAPLQKTGVDSKQALKQFLDMQGLSEKQLITALRDELTTKILKGAISSGTYVPAALTHDILSFKNETRNVSYVFYSNSAIVIKDKPSDADLEKYYQGISDTFMIPEHRDVTIAVLDSSKITPPKVSDDDVKSAYDENQDSFVVPEQAQVEQALFSDEDQAKKAVDAVKAGKNMKEAVKEIAGDTKPFQGRNSFAKNGLPDVIAGPVFAAKSGDVIGPIKSALGYHVIQLIKMDAAHTAPFDTVKEKIRKELQDEKSGNAVFDIISKIEDRLANGEQYEDMKDEYHLTLIPIKNLSIDSKADAELAFAGKDKEAVLKKIFSVSSGSSSELKDIGDNKLFSVRLDKLTPATPRPFSEVKESVLKRWVGENQSQENLLKTQRLADDLNAGKVEANSIKFQTLSTLGRDGSGAIGKDVTDRIMSAEVGQYVMSISKEKGGVYIFRVNSVILPKIDPAKEANAKQQLEADLSSSAYMGYLGSLQSKYPVTINEGLLKRAYGTSQQSAE